MGSDLGARDRRGKNFFRKGNVGQIISPRRKNG